MAQSTQRDCRNNAPVAEPSSDQEEGIPENFCSGMDIDEITFEKWCDHHSSLDLEYSVVISRAQLQQTFKTQIKLSRTIRVTTADGIKEKREKVVHDIVLTPEISLPRALVIKGQGDSSDGKSGDLVVVFCIRE